MSSFVPCVFCSSCLIHHLHDRVDGWSLVLMFLKDSDSFIDFCLEKFWSF